MTVKIKLIEGGKLPQMKHKGDCCYDCYARESVTIPNMESRTIKLGFAMQIPDGWEIQIRPRSGLSSKGITAEWGSGDCCYRGEYGATIFNHSGKEFEIKAGDRICQLAIRQIPGESKNKQNVRNLTHWLKSFSGNTAEMTKDDIYSALLIVRNAIAQTGNHAIKFEVVDALDETERGEKGFGSTGV